MSFAKNMVKNIGKNISKNLRGKYGPGMLARVAKLSNRMRQKLLDHDKQSATDVFKTASKRESQKPAKVTVDLISNKIANKITEF